MGLCSSAVVEYNNHVVGEYSLTTTNRGSVMSAVMYCVEMKAPNGTRFILSDNNRSEWSRSQAYKQAKSARALAHFAGYEIKVVMA